MSRLAALLAGIALVLLTAPQSFAGADAFAPVGDAAARQPPPQCFRECDPPCLFGSDPDCKIRIYCVMDPCEPQRFP